MAATNIPGISTLGVKFAYGVETSAGTKPLTFKQIERCNSIGGIELPTEQIDASALEDMVSKYVAGRQDTGGEWSVTFNDSPDVVTQVKAMIAASKEGKTSGLNTWFEVWSPYRDDAYFVVAEPPSQIPLPEHSQNELLTFELVFSINEYKGLDTKVDPTLE